MKKNFLIIGAIALIASICQVSYSQDLWNGIKNDFSNAANSLKNDIKTTTTSESFRGTSSPLSLQAEIDKVKAKKEKELAPIKQQISNKEAQMRSTIFDTKLSVSQKKAKTTLLQKEINTLKEQQKNIEEKYRQEIRSFRE